MDLFNPQLENSAERSIQPAIGRPLVDMSNPNEANTAQQNAGSGRDSAAIGQDGFINFSNPFEQAPGMDSHQWGGRDRWRDGDGYHHHDGGEGGANQPSENTGNGTVNGAGTDNGSGIATGTGADSGTGNQIGDGAGTAQGPSSMSQQQFEQTVGQLINTMETEITVLDTEIASLTGQQSAGSNTLSGSGAPNDAPPASGGASSGGPGDNGISSMPSQTTPSDGNAGGTATSSAPSDAGAGNTSASTTPADSSAGNTSSSTTPSDTSAGSAPSSSAPSDSNTVPTTTSQAPLESSTFTPSAIAGFSGMSPQEQIAATDPELNNILSNVNSQMSQSGAAQFNQIVQQDWSGGQIADDYSLMQTAIGQFQQAGGSSSDVATANNLLTTDIPNDDAVYTNQLQMNQALANIAPDYPVTSASGQYSTQGDQIIAPDGKPFIPVGGQVDWTQNYDPSPVIDNGANSVRMFIPHDPSQMPEFEQAVQQITAKGDVAILTATVDPNGHETGNVLTGAELNGLENMWSTLASQYKNNPNVWFDTLNESGGTNANDPNWLAQEQGVIGAIRSTGNNNMIMVDDSGWGQGATNGGTSALAANAKALEQTSDNIIGSLHIYQGGDELDDETKIQTAVDAIQSQGLPVMLGETGLWPAGNKGSMLAAMQVGEQDDIGRIELISGDGGNNSFVGDFITDASAIPDVRSAVLADWQAGQAENAAAQAGT